MLKPILKLSNDWKSNGILFVKGYLFNKNNLLFKEEELIDYFENIGNFEMNLKEANGSFAVIIILKDIILIGVDKLRTKPVFYSFINNEIVISDNAPKIKENLNLVKLNKNSLFEFKLSLFVSNNDTIVEKLKQVDAGQYIQIIRSSKNFIAKYYHYYLRNYEFSNINQTEAFSMIWDNSKDAFRRLIEGINGKTIIVPLSGGKDSRYIVSMLKELNYCNVICFTYGNPKNKEVLLSEKIAKKLGFDWCFVEYNDSKYNCYKDNDVIEYFKYSHNYVSYPHFQDFIAIRELIYAKKIPFDSIVVPGHSGDLLAGSHIAKIYLNKEIKDHCNIYDIIRKQNYNLHTSNGYFDQYLLKKIAHYFKDLKIDEISNFIDLTDAWNIANRQSKYIVNSTKVYDFFNLDWRLPLWDDKLTEFWFKMPFHKRRTIYYDFLNKELFNKHNVNYEFYVVQKYPTIKNIIKRAIPKNIIKTFLNLFERNNIKGFNKYLLKDITDNDDKIQLEMLNYFSLSSIWFIEFLFRHYNLKE